MTTSHYNIMLLALLLKWFPNKDYSAQMCMIVTKEDITHLSGMHSLNLCQPQSAGKGDNIRQCIFWIVVCLPVVCTVAMATTCNVSVENLHDYIQWLQSIAITIKYYIHYTAPWISQLPYNTFCTFASIKYWQHMTSQLNFPLYQSIATMPNLLCMLYMSCIR